MKEKPNEDSFLTRSDFIQLYRRNYRAIKRAAWICGALVFSFLVFQEPQFFNQATFQHSLRQNEISSSMKEMFQQYISLPAENGTMTILQSQALLKKTVMDLGLQIHLRKENWVSYLLKNGYENIIALLGNRLSDPDSFQFRKVVYSGERKGIFYLEPLSADAFRVLDSGREFLGIGRVGVPFQSNELEFILARMPKKVVSNRPYRMKVLPWQIAIKKTRAKLRIQKAKLDKGILTLSFKARDRHLGAEFLNHLMENYQQYLKRENEEICQAQLAYLENRQEELTKRLDLALSEHVSYLKENLVKDGHIGLMQEMDSLSGPRNEYLSKLLEIDLQMQRMEGYPDTQLPKKRRAKPIGSKREISAQISSVPSGSHHHVVANALKKEIDEHSLQFERLQHLPLTTREDSESNFVGLNLESSKNLWANYTGQRDHLHAQLRELTFLREQMNDPSFELSSAGVFFTDAVVNDLLHKASAVSLQLKDQQNRTPRDQERLQETLETQKRFLSEHLQQTIELTQLRCDLLEDKIASLRNATLTLLNSEKALLSEKLAELAKKMVDLPDKWRRESLLVLKKELGVRMIEGMTQLAEAKNISQNLYQANSKPIDLATPPLFPQTPLFLIFSLAAFLCGGGGTYFLFLCRMLSRGVPVSLEQLRAVGYPVTGALSQYCNTPVSQIQDTDLETLRLLSDQLSTFHCAAIVGGAYPDYSRSLAELLALRGRKVALLHTGLNGVVHPEDKPGLWQYLSGEEEEVVMRSQLHYDFLPSGGTSRFGAEWLSTPRFARLIGKLKEKYDMVLIYSTAHAGRAEGKALLSLADKVIVSTRVETKEELLPYFKKGNATFVCL